MPYRPDTLVRLLAAFAVVAFALAPAVIAAFVEHAAREEYLEREAEVQAHAVTRAVALQPGTWRTAPEPIVQTVDADRSRLTYTQLLLLRGTVLAETGTRSTSWSLTRSAQFREGGEVVGSVVVTLPFGPELRRLGLMLAMGLVLAGVMLYWLKRAVFDRLDAAEARIRNLAFYDSLTGLPNRRLLLERLQHALATARRNDLLGAVLYIDLDGFKSVNDTYGHEQGDRLLVDVARRLRLALRETDTVARLAGDEFLVLIEGIDKDESRAARSAEAAGAKILTALRQPSDIAGRSHRSSGSVGIALFRGERESAEDILRSADVAMYQAKEAGRDLVRFFDPVMQAELNDRAAIGVTLRGALERSEFRLFFQAQLDAERRVRGAEVLLRWRHPQYGTVPPSRFIPIAEESGLIGPIGRWVMERSCAHLKAWAGIPELRDIVLSVNVSARQFAQEDFVTEVQSALARTGAPADRLRLELTESLAVKDVAATIGKMEALRRLGVVFALDDFGTGQSSLSLLRKLPFAQIKIDQSFVSDLPGDANSAVLVRTIIAMAQSLGIEAVAEGVESRAQFEFLHQHACGKFQGYLFGEPLEVATFERYAGGAGTGRVVIPFARNA